MEIHIAHSQPIGTLIFDGKHKPFHALACPLRRSTSTRNSKRG